VRRSRAAIAPVAAVLAVGAAGAVAAVLLLDDSDSARDLASEPDIGVPAAVSAGSEQAPSSTAKKAKGKGKKSKAAGGQEDSLPTKVACPPQVTPAQCAEFRRTLKQARRKSHVVDFEGGECPFPTQAQCEEAGRAYKEGKRNSHVVDFEGGECPFPTQAQCEEAGRQYQQQRAQQGGG